MRVVLEHTQGAWAGMRQILGTLDQVKTSMQVSQLPWHIPNIDFGDRTNGATLVRTMPSYILYRECLPVDLSTIPSTS